MTIAADRAGADTKRIVSVSTALFDGYAMDLAIEEIARSGARHVEPAYIKGYVEFDESAFAHAAALRLREGIEGAGLAVHAVSAHLDLSQAGAERMLERRIGFAGEIGAKVLITNAGPAAAHDTIVSVLRHGLTSLRRAGVMLALENPGHGHGDLIGTAQEGRLLIDALGAEEVRLNHDAGNVFTYSNEVLQPADDYRAARAAIGHAHLKDVSSSPEGWRFVALGDGDVDLAGYLGTIAADLPISIELPLRLRRPGRADPQRGSERLDLETIRAHLDRSLAFVTGQG